MRGELATLLARVEALSAALLQARKSRMKPDSKPD